MPELDPNANINAGAYMRKSVNHTEARVCLWKLLWSSFLQKPSSQFIKTSLIEMFNNRLALPCSFMEYSHKVPSSYVL